MAVFPTGQKGTQHSLLRECWCLLYKVARLQGLHPAHQTAGTNLSGLFDFGRRMSSSLPAQCLCTVGRLAMQHQRNHTALHATHGTKETPSLRQTNTPGEQQSRPFSIGLSQRTWLQASTLCSFLKQPCTEVVQRIMGETDFYVLGNQHQPDQRHASDFSTTTGSHLYMK